MGKVLLKELAYARSGDKGDVNNVGLMAKDKEIYDFLKKEITPDRVKDHFKGMVKGDVEIYPLDNINCLEIILRRSLGGGATCTLRFDQTGKSTCGALQRMELEVDDKLIEKAAALTAEIDQKYKV